MFDFSPVRAAWENNVALFANPALWTQGGVALALGVGYAVGRQTDVAIANALGVGVRLVTIRAKDTAGRAPQPLDRLTTAGESLTIDFVTPVVLAGAVIGWRCYCAGARPGP